MNKRILIGCGIGILLLCCIVTITIILVLGNARVFTPSGVTIEVTAPEVIPVKKPFGLEISVRNDGVVDQILDSVDFSTSYLTGISVLSATPAYSDDFVIPIVDFRSYTFERNIEQFGTLVVKFVMEGQEEGVFEGEIDVCINDGSSCETFEISTIIGNGSGR